MVHLRLGKAKLVDWPGQLSVNEHIPLMGDIRTNQGDGFTHLYHAAKFGTQEGMWWASE